MSINGVLEDLALADVLQFVHLGRRTGTLYMWQNDERRAEIGFHDGRIVSAWTPGHKKLGRLLVDAEVIAPEELDAALDEQQGDSGERTLGQVLVDRGGVTREDIHRVIKAQVEETIFDLVTWQYGNFHFEVDELHPIDEIGLAPGELLADLDLNTQMLLLEATRIFDEKHRGQSPGLSPLDENLRRAGLARALGPGEPTVPETVDPAVGRESGAVPILETVRCQVVSDDGKLLAALRQGLPSELVRVISLRLHEAGNRLPGESASPIVVLDLRLERLTASDVATLARTRPTAVVVAVVESLDEAPDLRRAGAVAVLEAGDETLVECCRNLVRLFSHPQPQGTFGYRRRGYSSFRRVVFDVQSGLLSATMALNLLHVISESVERAVLFLVQGEHLRAVGAFGFSRDGEPLAELTSGLHVQLGAEDAFRQAVEEAKPLNLDYEAAKLPAELDRLLGPPATGQVVIFPVLGAERTISVIYTDNGDLDEEIQDIKILELATSQVGVAFENELLSQQMRGELGEESVVG